MLQTAVAAAATEAGWRKLIVPTDPTEFWTFVVAVVAILGLLSLWLVKKDMRNRTTREAAQTTIDRCEEMALVLIPALQEILKEMAAQKIAMFLDDPAKITFEITGESKKINAAITWLGTVPATTRDKALTLMNRLEVWSMSFVHDPALANEKVAFTPCSAAFCQMVMWLYPMLLTQRRLATPEHSGPYQNIVTLFGGWYKSQAKDQLLEQLVRLESGKSLPRPIS